MTTIKDLEKANLQDLHSELISEKAALNKLKFAVEAGQEKDVSKIGKLKKQIARIKTVISNK